MFNISSATQPTLTLTNITSTGDKQRIKEIIEAYDALEEYAFHDFYNDGCNRPITFPASHRKILHSFFSKVKANRKSKSAATNNPDDPANHPPVRHAVMSGGGEGGGRERGNANVVVLVAEQRCYYR
jgi:hypothetical protein